MDNDYLNSKINLGNLQFLMGNYVSAENIFNNIYSQLNRSGKGGSSAALAVLINLAKTNYKMECFDKADQYFEKAKAINPAVTEKYQYLSADNGKDTSRGAAVNFNSGDSIIFAGENNE